jgi:FtsZ-binding cell division protein ZapB
MSKQALKRKHPRGLVETPYTVDAATSATRPATPHLARATPSATHLETPPATPPETPKDDRKREVIRLYNEGRTYSQIASATGLSRGTVSRVLREAGLLDLDPAEVRAEVKGLKEALVTNISNTMQRVEALERRFDELKAFMDDKINALAGAMERVAAGRGPSTAVPPAVSTTVPSNNPSNQPEGKEGLQLEDERERSLKALEMLEQNMSPVDVMRVLGVEVEEMKGILADWRALRSAYAGKTAKDAMLIISKAMGESVRDVCEHYNQQTGTCTYWRITEMDEELRRSMPTIAKGVGGKLRYNVQLHPEVCASCPHGR